MRRLLPMVLVLFFGLVIVCFGADKYYSPTGNIEVWDEKPVGYLTEEEWALRNPPTIIKLPLEVLKMQKKMEADRNTDRIKLRDGLSFDGEHFSMTEGAMLKWTGLLAAKDILQTPYTILTIEDEPFVLRDKEHLLRFILAAMSYESDPTSALVTGRELRHRIKDAQTYEELETIVDNRQ